MQVRAHVGSLPEQNIGQRLFGTVAPLTHYGEGEGSYACIESVGPPKSTALASAIGGVRALENRLLFAGGVDRLMNNADANHDRVVDVSDLGVLASNWQTAVPFFSFADFNYDGMVDVIDLGVLATNWQKSLPAAGAPALRQPADAGNGVVGVIGSPTNPFFPETTPMPDPQHKSKQPERLQVIAEDLFG